MPIHPIVKLRKKYTILLDPEALIERPEVAMWIAQCIANWSWVESSTGSLFVNLLGTNLPTGAALYNDMASALSKDRALRSVALSSLTQEEYTLLGALLKLRESHQRARDRLAHWYWGVCAELDDGLVLVDPRYLIQYKANVLHLNDKNQPKSTEFDVNKIYAVRVKDLKEDTKKFAEFAKLTFKFADLVAEKDQRKREQQRRELSNDVRLRATRTPSASPVQS